MNATGEADDLPSAILLVAHGANLSGINFRHNPDHKKILGPLAEKTCERQLENKLTSENEHYLQDHGKSLCFQLAKYWQDVYDV